VSTCKNTGICEKIKVNDDLPAHLARVLEAFDARESGHGWVGFCTNPTHGDDGIDNHPSLWICMGEDGKILVKCRVGCKTEDVLDSVGLTMYNLFPHSPEDEGWEDFTPARRATLFVSDHDANARHEVYSMVLGTLPLLANDLAALRLRGLGDDAIARYQYRSLRDEYRANVAAAVKAQFGMCPGIVPGFVYQGLGDFAFGNAGTNLDGIVVPLRDFRGRVIALKVRRPRMDPKYIYLSTENGPSPGNPCHVPLHAAEHTLNGLVYVTEGEFKADIITQKTGTLCLSSPGVSAWRSVLLQLKYLRDVKQVLVAFDHRDVVGKKPVRDQVRAFLTALRDNGYAVGLVTWANGIKYKGYDDFLAAWQSDRKEEKFRHDPRPTEFWGEEAFALLDELARWQEADAAQADGQKHPQSDGTAPGAQAKDKADAAAASPTPPGKGPAKDDPGYSRGVTTRELMEMDLPPAKFAVPELIPEGLMVLAGKPKLGKSWFALLLALEIAAGGRFLGRQVEQGDVLYLALEDHLRRMKKRIGKLLGGKHGSDHLHLWFKWRRQDKGGLADLDQWIRSHPKTRMIIVDTWKRFRAPAGNRHGNAYEQDYDTTAPVQELASKYGVTILLVHHTRKPKSGETAQDFLDEINGSYGLSGGVDNGMVLSRARCQSDAMLSVTGRDIEEEQQLPLKWDKDQCLWSLAKNAATVPLMSEERQEIIDVIDEAGGPLRPLQVASRLGKGRGAVRKLMMAMRDDKELYSVGGGRYDTKPSETPQEPTPPEEDSGGPSVLQFPGPQ
jgi:hypothetical protein